MDRGHLAPREAFAGYADAEKAADYTTNVVPMNPEFNQRGAWRQAEERANQLARQHGYVDVKIDVIYDPDPAKIKKLSDGTPIPKGFIRTVKAPDGKVLEIEHLPHFLPGKSQ